MQLAGLRLRQFPQVIHQPGKLAGLVVQAGDFGLIQRVDIVQNGLQIALDDGERGAEFVGDIGEQVLTQDFGLLQLIRHLVERLGDIPDFLGAADLNPAGEIALPDGAGGVRQFGEGRGEVATEQHPRGDADQRRPRQDGCQVVKHPPAGEQFALAAGTVPIRG